MSKKIAIILSTVLLPTGGSLYANSDVNLGTTITQSQTTAKLYTLTNNDYIEVEVNTIMHQDNNNGDFKLDISLGANWDNIMNTIFLLDESYIDKEVLRYYQKLLLELNYSLDFTVYSLNNNQEVYLSTDTLKQINDLHSLELPDILFDTDYLPLHDMYKVYTQHEGGYISTLTELALLIDVIEALSPVLFEGISAPSYITKQNDSYNFTLLNPDFQDFVLSIHNSIVTNGEVLIDMLAQHYYDTNVDVSSMLPSFMVLFGIMATTDLPQQDLVELLNMIDINIVMEHDEIERSKTADINFLVMLNEWFDVDSLLDFGLVDSTLQTGIEIKSNSWSNTTEYIEFEFDINVAPTFIEEYTEFVRYKEIPYSYIVHYNGGIFECNGLGITDISSIGLLPDLLWVNMHDNFIKDISPLAQLEHLQIIMLINNLIEDISPLANMQYLNMLVVRDNQISDISVLSSIPNLGSINLINNNITDISVLLDMPNLICVYLQGNPLNLKDKNTKYVIDSLLARGVDVQY
ncbi:MAG: hypothetical protein BEN18_08335 [Epulopiscium sp. Nuni2H_MBin001]|nr:MAG: hypothetical protein BEN18_08335 [Epulopiscium sp. Nuni2H_MBin001]